MQFILTLLNLNCNIGFSLSGYCIDPKKSIKSRPGVILLLGLSLSALTCTTSATEEKLNLSTQVPEKTMRVLANHLPPYMFINRDTRGKVYDGFEHDLATSLARELGFNLQYIECDWQECLRQLKTGEIDLAHNLLRSKARESFLEFIHPTYLKGLYTTVFYQRFNDSRVIDDFDDLITDGFVVGYLGSTVYFPKFENTERLLKMDVKNRETGLRLLASGKIDVLAGFDELFDGIELESPNIKKVMKKSRFKADAELESYSAISKASPLFKERKTIATALKKLKDSGDLQKWKLKWFKNHPTITTVTVSN